MKKLISSMAIASIVIVSFAQASSDLDSLLKELDGTAAATGATTSTTHSAGEVSIENISYTTDGKDLYTVSWTSLVGSSNVKVEIKESKEADYFTLNTVKGSDGKIDIKLPTAGQYQVRLTAIDSASNTAISKEYIQTIKVDGVAAPTTNTTTTTPKTDTPVKTNITPVATINAHTGPAESAVVFSVLMGLIFYGVYRFRRAN